MNGENALSFGRQPEHPSLSSYATVERKVLISETAFGKTSCFRTFPFTQQTQNQQQKPLCSPMLTDE